MNVPTFPAPAMTTLISAPPCRRRPGGLSSSSRHRAGRWPPPCRRMSPSWATRSGGDDSPTPSRRHGDDPAAARVRSISVIGVTRRVLAGRCGRQDTRWRWGRSTDLPRRRAAESLERPARSSTARWRRSRSRAARRSRHAAGRRSGRAPARTSKCSRAVRATTMFVLSPFVTAASTSARSMPASGAACPVEAHADQRSGRHVAVEPAERPWSSGR